VRNGNGKGEKILGDEKMSERERERGIWIFCRLQPDSKTRNCNPTSFHSRRSRRLRSRVAESSNAAEEFFFIGNDGRGRAFGDGDIANADPAYTSLFTAESSDWPLRRIVTFSKPWLLATRE